MSILPFRHLRNIDGTYRIECLLIVYRQKLGKHPDFLKPVGDNITGYYTKYFLSIEDNILSEEQAVRKANDYNKKYDSLIEKCEDTGDWSDFPFKDCEIIYYK